MPVQGYSPHTNSQSAPQNVGGQCQIALPPATNAGAVYYRLMK
jgi:hypothetical protein